MPMGSECIASADTSAIAGKMYPNTSMVQRDIVLWLLTKFSQNQVIHGAILVKESAGISRSN